MCMTKYLYKITNRLDDFYVIAEDVNSAITLLLKSLDKSDYGYSDFRYVTDVKIIASEEFYSTGKQRFNCDPYKPLLIQKAKNNE